MLNNWSGTGRTTKDIDLRYSQAGTAVANYTIAINRPFKSANGEQETDFINIVQFGKGAEVTAQYVKKGNQIGVTGRIQTRNYENNEGKRVYVTEVVANQVAFLETKNSQNNQQQNQYPDPDDPIGNAKKEHEYLNKKQQSDPFQNNNGKPIDISDDDLPF